MSDIALGNGEDASVSARIETLLAAAKEKTRYRTDRLFAGLMSIQWLAGIFAALLLSPRSWVGPTSRLHVHVIAAFVIGTLISGLPIALAMLRPGRPSTGYIIAVGQMLTSALLIHLSGGRIETHFHVFVSLALLAFYRDWRVLVTGGAVIAVDHLLRGLFWPMSVYGVLTASPWRAAEHGAWVVFEVCVLYLAIRHNVRDMMDSAESHARLESSRRTIEAEMQERTRDLRESEERFRALSMSSPIGIFETDGLGRCVYTNRSWQEIFGLTLEESLGDGWSNPIHEDDRQPIVDGWHACASRNVPFDREFRLRDASFGERWVRTRAASILDENGTVTGFVGTVEDVTRARSDEAELVRAREAALSTARLKSEFLANMSHEIRTPLNGVIGMTELTLETDLTREQREYLETVRTSADALLGVIEDILDFSKIEAGKLELDPTETSLRDTVDMTLKTLALRADKKGLELVSHIRPDVPDAVLMDAGRMRQILLNLVGNAVKFTPQGEVVVSVVAESMADDSAVLHFCVADTGIGIPADKQAAIFESFTQADMSTSRRFGGTGLGLAISSRLVAMMGGRIWVESEPGKGSQFHFTARIGIAAGTGTSAPAEDTPMDLRGLRVLVVDDNATNRRVLGEMLSQWQILSTAVEEGYTALAQLASARSTGTPFDLVLLDRQMPGLDGFDVAARIRESPEFAAVTLMMLTSGGQVGDAARCRELGMTGYLVKPVSQTGLIDAIREALPSRGGTGGALAASKAHVVHAPVGKEGSPMKDSTARPLRVLVVEDNAVNQLVAVRLLEKLGHQAVLAENGSRALQVLERERFDLVLMDVQMPVIGGFEATAEIRSRERESGDRVPILGLTAHAMKGDRERCLAAGMDDCVTKPIKAPVLIEAMERLTAARRVDDLSAGNGPAAEADDDPEILDLDQARENVCGDPDLLAEVARVFRAESPRQLEDLRLGIAQGDAPTIERGAHRLRGSLSTLGAGRAAAAAGCTEDMAAAGDLAAIVETVEELEREIARLLPAIERLAEGEKAA